MSSHKSSSGHPSCSSISASSSYTRDYKKCRQCGKKLSKLRPNRQCAMELDLDDEYASVETLHLHLNSPKGSSETTPTKSPVHNSELQLKKSPDTSNNNNSQFTATQELYLKQQFCDKCWKEKSLNANELCKSGSLEKSSQQASPSSVNSNGLRVTVNVFTFIRATFNRILESKTSSSTAGPNGSTHAATRSNSRKNLGMSRQSSIHSPSSEPSTNMTTTAPIKGTVHPLTAGGSITKPQTECGSYVNPLGCSSESLDKWKLSKDHDINCIQQQPKSSVSSGVVSNATGSMAPISDSTKSHRHSSEHVGFVFHDPPVANQVVVSPTANERRHWFQFGRSQETSAPGGSFNSNQNSTDVTPNEFQADAMETDEFLENLPTYYAARMYYGAPTQVDLDMFHHRNPRFHGQYKSHKNVPLGAAYSLPSQTRSITSQGGSQVSKDLMCSTWPPLGRRVFVPTYFEETFDRNDSFSGEPSESRRCSSNDFNIPFDDIKLLECVKNGRRKNIYRGNWHGDVMVHVYHVENYETRRFWQEVEKLTTIRHENIDLFMGASFEPLRCCIVTNAHYGSSLYDKLHQPGQEKTSLQFTHHVLCQLVKALGYLHARSQKPIVVGRLTSRCVFIEPGVVLTLLDYENYADEDCIETGELCLPNLFLFYAAPELLWTSTPSEPRMVAEALFTTATDVFAFGTIVYELVTNDFPFSHLTPDKLVQAVSYGQRANFTSLKISDFLKGLLRECWSQDPLSRPEFSYICECLLHGQFTHKRHSSSEPENLHRNNSLFSRYNFE